jgi:hypothetical protein
MSTAREDLHRIGDTLYGTPFRDHEGRPMVDVHEPDGDRYVTYWVPAELRPLIPPRVP